MSLDTDKSSETYTGNGSTRNFNIPFRLDDNSQLEVYVTNKAVTPYVPTLIPSTDYTVSEGVVTYPKSTNLSALSSTKTITLKRVLPLKQETKFINLSGVYLERLEEGFDKQMMATQQIQEQVNRSVKVPIGSGINPDDYLTRIELAASQASASATVAQNATIDMPAVPFKEVFGIGGTNPFNLLQSHNGNVADASIGSSTFILNLPKMNTLVFPYTTSVRLNSFTSGTITVYPAVGDTINGQASITLKSVGDVLTFVADDDSLLGTWKVIYHLADVPTDGITESKILNSAVTTDKIADDAVTTAKIADSSIGLSQLSVAVNNLLDGLVGNGIQDQSPSGSPYNLTTSTRGNILRVTASSSVVYNLPVISTSVAPHVVLFKRVSGTSSITLNAGAGNTIEGGASYVMSTTVGDSILISADFSGAGAGNWTVIPLPSASSGSGSIAPGSITSTELATDSVITTKIAALNVTGAKIADATITGAKLVNATVTSTQIASGTVALGNMASASVGTTQVVDAAITNAKMATDSVGTTNIIDLNVTGAKIAATTITQGKMANGSIGTAQIIDANVTNAKMASASVGTSNIIDANVTGAKIASATITGSNIASATIDTANIATSAITNTLLATNSVSNAKIFDNAITTAKIADTNVTNAKMASASVGTSNIIDANVTQAKLASASVGTSQIIDSNVTQAKLDATLSSTIDNVFPRDVLAISASTTLSATHKGCLINVTAASTVTITLPQISTLVGPFTFRIRRYSGASTITFNRSGTDTINHGTSTGLTTFNMPTTTIGDWIEICADFTGATANQWFTMA